MKAASNFSKRGGTRLPLLRNYDPNFNRGNDSLIDELECIVKRCAIILEHFKEICPN